MAYLVIVLGIGLLLFAMFRLKRNGINYIDGSLLGGAIGVLLFGSTGAIAGKENIDLQRWILFIECILIALITIVVVLIMRRARCEVLLPIVMMFLFVGIVSGSVPLENLKSSYVVTTKKSGNTMLITVTWKGSRQVMLDDDIMEVLLPYLDSIEYENPIPMVRNRDTEGIIVTLKEKNEPITAEAPSP